MLLKHPWSEQPAGFFTQTDRLGAARVQPGGSIRHGPEDFPAGPGVGNQPEGQGLM